MLAPAAPPPTYSENLLHDFVSQLGCIKHQTFAPLAPHTTLGIGGCADVLITPSSLSELQNVLNQTALFNLPVLPLGGGSNLLISDEGIAGVVLLFKENLASIEVSDDGHTIIVGAGASFPVVTKTALKLGWEIALGWGGTPGQIGGAVRMNAGTRLGEIGPAVYLVEGMCQGKLCRFTKEQIQFSYRKAHLPDNFVISRVHLKWPDANKKHASSLLQQALHLSNKRKKNQPKIRSAGCVFKNPIPRFAGELIEAAELKGLRQGGAQISPVHGNFIVNTGGAKATDVVKLIQKIEETIYNRFHIPLEREVRLINRFSGFFG